MIYDAGDGHPLETLAVSRYGVGDTFKQAWDQERDGDQWQHLGKLIAARQPKRIAINYSDTFALADGISHTEYGLLMGVLTEELRARVVPAEKLAVAWLQRGMLQIQQGNLTDARTDLTQALELGASPADAYYQLARLDLAAGDRAAARRSVVKVLESDADHPAALALLAELDKK